jgi:hypothetical protein
VLGQVLHAVVLLVVQQSQQHQQLQPVDLLPVGGDHVVDGDLGLDRVGGDRQDLDPTDERPPARDQHLAGQPDPGRPPSVEHDHDRAGAHAGEPVQRPAFAGEQAWRVVGFGGVVTHRRTRSVVRDGMSHQDCITGPDHARTGAACRTELAG